jgi:hypothetical protein
MVDTGAVIRRHLPLGAVAVVLALALLGAACSSTGYHYVKNSDDRTYFKVPDGWKLFDEDQLTAKLSPHERETTLESSWQVAFDASPKPSLKHLLAPRTSHPNGYATVQDLNFDASDNVSTSALRNFFFDIDSAVQGGTGSIISYEPLEPDGGFRGFRLVAEVDTPDRHVVTVDETMLLDQATSKLYALVVTCDARCYDHNSDQIERVVKSWTVEA